jgi:predicted methyltransferase
MKLKIRSLALAAAAISRRALASRALAIGESDRFTLKFVKPVK